MKPSTRMMLLAGRKSDGRDNDRYNRENERERDRDYNRDNDRYRRDMEYSGGRRYNDKWRDGDYNRPDEHREDRHVPQSRMWPYEPYPMYPPPMDNRYDDDDYRGTNMGFMHHDKGNGYDFEMNGKAGKMRGYASGRIMPVHDDEQHRKWAQEEVEPLDEKTAKKWANSMENADGTKGPHWTMEETEKVMKEKGIKCDPIDFWLAMNATYSDLCKEFKKYGIDKIDAYVDFAMAFWLCDEDSVEDKLSAYYEYVVEK